VKVKLYFPENMDEELYLKNNLCETQKE